MYYYVPAMLLFVSAYVSESPFLYLLSALLFLVATIAIPGYMSHYCKKFDYREIFNPKRALMRSMEGGKAYWHAWLIAMTALAISFLGLLFIGIGFFLTSVWFWQVAGYSFATVFSQTYELCSYKSSSHGATYDFVIQSLGKLI